jgi:hypothetical protein
MATRGGQTHNKRARELALKEKRERKQAKKDDRRAGIYPEPVDGYPEPVDGETEPVDDGDQPEAALEP